MQIKDYSDYFVTCDGLIFSSRSNKYLKFNIGSNGYKTVMLFNNEGSKRKSVHRLVAETFLENPKNLPQVNHKNGNKLDNRLENLEWCTVKYNSNHAWENNLHERTRNASRINQKENVKKAWEVTKKKVIDINSGIIFDSITQAAESKNYELSSLCKKLKGKRNNNTPLRFL